MKESLNNFIKSVGDNGLMVLELPTGFGKTYNVQEYVYDFLMGKLENPPSRIFYLTPLKKNIGAVYDDIREKFKKENKTEVFDSNVLLLKPNYESVICALKDLHDDDEFTKLEVFKKLKSKVDSYYRLRGQTEDYVNQDARDVEDQIREEFEPAFRRELERKIASWVNEKTYSKKLKRLQNEFAWIIDAYPAILSKKRKVIITTVDKFYYGNNTILDKHYRFIVNSITEKALIYIDESDSAKQKLLDSMIEECTEYKLDTLRVVKTIQHAINNDKVSNDLFKQLPTDDINKTTVESFKKLKNVFANLYEQNNLDYPFKFESEDSDSFFLFHDFSSITVIGGKTEHKISVKCDKRRNLNILSISDNNDDSFNKLIRSLHGALKFFINFCNTTAKNYLSFKNNGDPIEKMEIEDAVTSVLNCFTLSDAEIKVLTRIVINNYKTPKLEIKKAYLTYDLYDDGFQYFGFENDPSHDFNTKILLSFLNDTPEKFLLTLSRRAYVVCLSATANSKTVTGNFNIQYLIDNLGSKYYKLPTKKLNELKQFYDTKRSIKHDISIKTCELVDSRHPENSVFSDACLEMFETITSPYSYEEPNKDGERYYVNRFCKFAMALKSFVQDKNSKVMLAVTNKNLRLTGDDIYRIENVKKVVNLAMKECRVEKEPIIIPLSSADFEIKKTEYKQRAKARERIILITSFPTASTGQNLQYEIEENGILKEFDIDTIYIENPTNLLTQLGDYNRESDLIRYVYQTLSLRSSGELTYNEAFSTIETAFRDMGFYRKNTEQIDYDKRYKTNSVNNHAVSNIKQALGRINRTVNKNNTTVLVDGEIFKKRWFDDEKGKMQTLEFAKLIEKTNNQLKPQPIDDQKLKAAVTNCKSSQNTINSLMRLENESWKLANYNDWNHLRDFVLKHPTISSGDLDENIELKGLYLEGREGYDIAYYFVKTKDNDFEQIEKISYIETNDCNVKVNEAMCNLIQMMTIKDLKDHFIKNGYAVNFDQKKYILLPNVMRNIYMGALGEVAGKYVFDKYIKEALSDITDLTKFEKFDYQLKNNEDVYIDFKNWNQNKRIKSSDYEKKCAEKLNKIGGKALFIINMFSTTSDFKPYRSEFDKRIMVFPNIFKQSDYGYIIDEKVCSWIKKYIGDLNHEN